MSYLDMDFKQSRALNEHHTTTTKVPCGTWEPCTLITQIYSPCWNKNEYFSQILLKSQLKFSKTITYKLIST